MVPFEREIAVVREGFATPSTWNPATGTFLGCLYSPEGGKLALSQRFFGVGFQFRPEDPDRLDPAVAAAAPRLSGRTLYLGHYLAHYGHFLTETLSTFWIFEKQPAAAFDRIAFHPGFFGRTLTGYARHCFAAFGIAPEAVVMLDDGPVRFEEVVVPERLLRLCHAADPLLRGVFDRIRAATLAGRDPVPSRGLYISRRSSYWRTGRRIVANEAIIEELFRSRGFAIVRPEAVPFPDQVALYAAAPTLAGLSGSALHNCLFQRPGGRLIEIEHPDVYREGDSLPARTQDLCNAVAGVAGTFVPFTTGRSLWGGQVRHIDPASVAAALKLRPTTRTPIRRRLAAAIETGALDLLPPVRAATGRLRQAARAATGRLRRAKAALF
jgi:hypothetical protein